jgi:peptidoglycan hydrolase-like protein with peptidoglycan-binding domain
MKSILELIASVLAIIVFSMVLYDRVQRKRTVLQGDVQLAYGSTGSDVMELQKRLNKVINSQQDVVWHHDNQAIAITDMLPEDGMFTNSVELALNAITGLNTIYVSQINSIA